MKRMDSILDATQVDTLHKTCGIQIRDIYTGHCYYLDLHGQTHTIPGYTKAHGGSILGHRLRRWPNIKPP